MTIRSPLHCGELENEPDHLRGQGSGFGDRQSQPRPSRSGDRPGPAVHGAGRSPENCSTAARSAWPLRTSSGRKKAPLPARSAAPMLLDAGCRYVIIGHSERRQHFGETDAAVNKKIRAALKSGLAPIVCLGETLAERERNETMARITRQVEEGWRGVDASGLRAGRSSPTSPSGPSVRARRLPRPRPKRSTPHIREKLALQYGIGPAECAIILYGGSVKPANSFALLSEKNIDGFLVGGASLEAESFIQIAREAIKGL